MFYEATPGRDKGPDYIVFHSGKGSGKAVTWAIEVKTLRGTRWAVGRASYQPRELMPLGDYVEFSERIEDLLAEVEGHEFDPENLNEIVAVVDRHLAEIDPDTLVRFWRYVGRPAFVHHSVDWSTALREAIADSLIALVVFCLGGKYVAPSSWAGTDALSA